MESTLKDILERRSSRKYRPDQISEDELDRVLEAGMYAPSAMNRQSSVMVVLQDRDEIAHLSRMNASIMGSDGDPFYGAPTVIIVLGDRGNRNAVQDGSLVMGNLMNAAHSLGLGSCWIHRAKEIFDSAEGKEMLDKWGIHGEYEGIGFCIVGYAKEGYSPVAKPRKAGYVIHVE